MFGQHVEPCIHFESLLLHFCRLLCQLAELRSRYSAESSSKTVEVVADTSRRKEPRDGQVEHRPLLCLDGAIATHLCFWRKRRGENSKTGLGWWQCRSSHDYLDSVKGR